VAPKLLFVDSSLSHAVTFECFFRDAGFDVTCVTSCTEAASILEDLDFDLVITDFDCPFVNGNQMVEGIAARSRPIPVIVHTSDINSIVPSPVIKEVVLKPASIFRLSEVIDRSLGFRVC
jgi:DNA-binding NtrC family response regulator